MNEVAAPFIILDLQLPEAYACFDEFMDRLLYGMFVDSDFYLLQS